MSGPLRRDGADWVVEVRVQPRASRTEFAGLLGDRLKVRLQAPPVDGRANAALLEDTALEWAQLGNDLLVAHRQEASAREAERALMDTTNQLRRAEAFLEETEARRGRALAQLNHPEEVPVPPSPAASRTANLAGPAGPRPGRWSASGSRRRSNSWRRTTWG